MNLEPRLEAAQECSAPTQAGVQWALMRHPPSERLLLPGHLLDTTRLTLKVPVSAYGVQMNSMSRS